MLAARGGVSLDITDEELEGLLREALHKAFSKIKNPGPVIIIPPDITRFHSRAGFLIGIAARVLESSGYSLGAVMPALGTHMALTEEERLRMFPDIPKDKFLVHSWRNDVETLGRLEGSFVGKVTEGKVNYDWPVEVNRQLVNGGFSMILSIGQVVPHEVTGMANHLKNIFVGLGGKEAIDKSHFAGASIGIEKILGRAETPVRSLFDEGYRRFGSRLPPIFYALTVIGARSENEAAGRHRRAEPKLPSGKPEGSLAVRGFYAGFGRECFENAAALSRQVNVDLVGEPVKKAVVYLSPDEFRTTWLGNKAVYRTRMAMADGGELLILAPGLLRFGEDPEVDRLIRKFGYRPGSVILEKTKKEKELGENLSVAAHLIHGSSEERFTVRYCPPSALSRAEIEAAGYEWGNLDEAMEHYGIKNLSPGWNTHSDGEKFFFVPNPALGLWAEKKRFI